MTAVIVAVIVAIFGAHGQATAPAVRLGPQTTVAPEPEPQPPAGLAPCDEMAWYRAHVGLPATFDRIGYRESRCLNRDDVRTFCCHGWWQMYTSLHLRDHRLAPMMAACGVSSHHDLNSDTHLEKLAQACAAKALYDVNGTNPWKATR